MGLTLETQPRPGGAFSGPHRVSPDLGPSGLQTNDVHGGKGGDVLSPASIYGRLRAVGYTTLVGRDPT